MIHFSLNFLERVKEISSTTQEYSCSIQGPAILYIYLQLIHSKIGFHLEKRNNLHCHHPHTRTLMSITFNVNANCREKLNHILKKLWSIVLILVNGNQLRINIQDFFFN